MSHLTNIQALPPPPDGQKIAFASQETSAANDDIYVMNANGSNRARLTDNPAHDSSPEYAPDGAKITFSSFRDDNWEVYTMNDSGSGQTRITNTTGSSIAQHDTPSSWGALNTTVAKTTLDSSDPSGLVNTRSATFAFSNEPGSIFECKLDNGSFQSCASPKTYNNLSNGQHTFEVRAISAAGNTDPTPASRTWTVDATPPNVTITSGPSGAVNTASATFDFTASDATSGVSGVSCKLDDANFAPCDSFSNGSGRHSVAGLPDGQHTFRVKATDAAGNSSIAARTWTVDTMKPRVNRVVPAEDATRIAPGANVYAIFSEAMKPDSVVAAVKLYEVGSRTALPATVSYDATRRKATLNPESNLRRGVRYKGVVLVGAKDRAGNRLDQDPSLSGDQPKVWFFKVTN